MNLHSIANLRNPVPGKSSIPLAMLFVALSAPGSAAAVTTTAELSRSITTEALTGYPDGKEVPAILRSSILTGTISGLKSSAETGADPTLPSAESMLPSVPLTLADGRITASVAPASTSMAYNGDEQRFNLNLGMGYYQPERGDGGVTGTGALATMIGSQLAVGTVAVIYDIKRDLVLNTVWQVPNSGLRFKLSGGYLWGDQEFDFASGQRLMGLEQYSYALSTTWVVPEADECRSLHSIGASVWGAEANQTENPDPVYFRTEDASDLYFWRDPLKLSEGRLFGFSGDMQLALSANFVTKGSLGYEKLEFPFVDGTRETDNSLYSNIACYWEPASGLTLGADWKNGAGEDRFMASAEVGHFTLSGWYSKGQSGLQDDKGAMLTYSLFTEKHPKGTSLARRMRPSRATSSAALLTESMQRPVHLPETFLAKVDLTAVTLEATVSKAALGSVATVDSTTGDIYVTITGGAASISAATKDGTAYTVTAAQFEVASAKLVIHTAQLPEGAATYVITVTNAATTSADYNVTVVTE